MASRLQCSLFRQSAPLRQCSSLSHVRLFHVSPAAAIKKPSRAIVSPTKPASASAPARRRPSSPPKKLQLPFKTSHPSYLPIGTTGPSPAYAQPHSATAPSTSSPISSNHVQPAPPTALPEPATAPRNTPRNAHPPPSPVAYHARPATQQYQTFLNHLATRPEPTVIYSTHGQGVFVLICATSAIFFTYLAWVNVPTIRFGSQTGSIGLVITTTMAAMGMSVASVAFGLGPHHLIRRVVALPAAVSKQQLSQRAVQDLQPTLRFEPLRVVFGIYPKPFEVPVGEVVSDRPFALELEKFASNKSPSVFTSIFSSFWALFARREYFTYVRVAERGNWKLPLQNAQALDGGRAFDQLIKVDQQAVRWKSKLVRS
ncbi:hypothetical protein MBLNU459_g8356t1 [Dothideomycetes sp. NU459]